VMEYGKRREQLYGPLRAEGTFTWDSMYGEEYALADMYWITEEERHELAIATERLGRIFTRTTAVVQQASVELFAELGIPEEAWNALRISVWGDVPTVIGRFDFARTPQGLKMLEFNSDTPTGIVEAFYVNEHVCQFYGARNPNRGMERDIAEAFQTAVSKYHAEGYAVERIVFSALEWHEEDAGTTRYLLRQSGLPATFVPLKELRVYDDRLCALIDEETIPIDVLYRLHALEKLAEEKDVDGYPTGAHVLDIISRKKLAIINPPAAFIAQTKALQGLIWSLYESGEFFAEEERETIGRYMLPTYFENRFAGKEPYVVKPIFGREGGGVTLYDAHNNIMERDREALYWEQPMIYQQLAPLETLRVETLKGAYDGHLLWGSFLLGGRASAIVARVGGKITGNMAYYLPVGIKNTHEREENEDGIAMG
jgi:glutathionylspermidine synthase